MVLPDSAHQSAKTLAGSWNQHWSPLHSEQASKQAIDDGIGGVRNEILQLLSELQ